MWLAFDFYWKHCLHVLRGSFSNLNQICPFLASSPPVSPAVPADSSGVEFSYDSVSFLDANTTFHLSQLCHIPAHLPALVQAIPSAGNVRPPSRLPLCLECHLFLLILWLPPPFPPKPLLWPCRLGFTQVGTVVPGPSGVVLSNLPPSFSVLICKMGATRMGHISQGCGAA